MIKRGERPLIDKPSARALAELLQADVLEGFGRPLSDLRFGSPRHELLARLHYSAATFAAHKNHQMIRDLLLAKRNEGGLKAAARRINKQYNKQYLAAERATMRLQSIGARKWIGFEERADRFPNLRYSAVLDGRTRPRHRAWHGIIRPISDSFWDTHYPQNGWRCRCAVFQTAKPARKLPRNLPAVPKLFRHNAAKTGMLFKGSHPYFKNVPRRLPEEAMRFAIGTLREQVKQWAFKNLTGKTFEKEGLQAAFTRSSINKVLNQPHKEKYFQMLTLLDFENYLRKQTLIDLMCQM